MTRAPEQRDRSSGTAVLLAGRSWDAQVPCRPQAHIGALRLNARRTQATSSFQVGRLAEVARRSGAYCTAPCGLWVISHSVTFPGGRLWPRLSGLRRIPHGSPCYPGVESLQVTSAFSS